MNILLTGSGGFVGTHLKKALEKSYNLLTPRSYELNLLDKQEVVNYFDKNKIDFIIHCAAAGVRNIPNATHDDVARPNIEMFNNLAKHVSDNCEMIVLGSGAEYDKSKDIINVKEESFGKYIPKDPYGYSKYLISKEIEKRDNILNLRLFGVYGYGEHFSRVTSCIINDNLSHRPIILNQNVKFDFLYINDLCKIVQHFIEVPTKEKFVNITPTESIEIIDIAKKINNISNYQSEIIIKKEGMNKEYTGNNSLLLSLLGNFRFTSYDEGLRDLYNLFANDKFI